MNDKNMIALAEIRNNYSLKKCGNLNSDQIALLQYDDLCANLIKENQELKKKIKKMQSGIDSIDAATYYVNDNLYKYIAELENQQKEFIKYLEDELNLIDNVYLLEETDEDFRRYLLIQHDIFKNLVEDLKDSIKRGE